ncbi:MAG: acylphosphatase [Microbacterium sp.]
MDRPGVSARRRVRVHGLVQGVGFRYSTAREAQRLSLAGWVKNLLDGSVETEIVGAPDALDHMVAWLRHGPSSARVDRIEVSELEPRTDSGDGFVIV